METPGYVPVILHVEDDKENITCHFRACYEKYGNIYDIVGSFDGRAALDEIEQGAKFDLVVVDLELPRLGGDELIREIKKRFPTMPIICTTGYDLAPKEATKTIIKPHPMEDLADLVRETLIERGLLRP